MADTVIDKDLGWERISRELKLFQQLDVVIGFQGIHGEVAIIATYHEFGTEDIPARPFLRSAFEVAQEQIGKMMEEAVDAIILGTRTAIQAAERLGLFGINLVKKRINDSPAWAEELNALTIKIKGSTKPLVDTAQMLNSITYAIMQGKTQVAAG